MIEFLTWLITPLFSSVVVSTVFVFCLICLPLQNSGRIFLGFATHATTLITSSGIFFTFLGIYLGLQGFSVSDIDNGITQLLEGMKTAFVSSVLGIGLSIVFRFIRFALPERLNVAAGNMAEQLGSLISEVKSGNDQINLSLNNLADALGGERDSSVVGQLSRLRSSTQDGFETLNQSFKGFLETLAEDNSKSLIEALEGVMRDFNTKINEQFGDNFKQLNIAVGNLLSWQENYKTQLEQLLASFDEIRSGVAEFAGTMELISKSAATIPENMEKLKKVQTDLGIQLDETRGQLTVFAEMRTKAADAFPTIQNALDELVDNFSTKLEALLNDAKTREDSFRGLLEDTHKANKEIADGAGALVRETTTSLENAILKYNETASKLLEQQDEEYKRLISQTSTKMQETYQSAVSNLEGSVSDLDKAMEEEVLRVVTIMGQNLVAITSKFVDQYQAIATPTDRSAD